LPLKWQGHLLGSLEPMVVEALLNDGFIQSSGLLVHHTGSSLPDQHASDQPAFADGSLQIGAKDLNSAFGVLAGTLRRLGMAGAWRNELLAVRNEQGVRLGAVERGVVRTLGITTEAVHLVGFCEDGSLWVQQRSWTKANDPGLWDTLMGGMISDQDTLETALQRETWEEAGLHIADLQDLKLGGSFLQQRPSDDGAGGYLQEGTHWYSATVPEHLKPINQDGEVAQFARLGTQEVVQGLAQGHYTLEASLILVDALALRLSVM
jgi:8-oxo-dGTP pyrophosphatase MutT (NUDIX family)